MHGQGGARLRMGKWHGKEELCEGGENRQGCWRVSGGESRLLAQGGRQCLAWY